MRCNLHKMHKPRRASLTCELLHGYTPVQSSGQDIFNIQKYSPWIYPVTTDLDTTDKHCSDLCCHRVALPVLEMQVESHSIFFLWLLLFDTLFLRFIHAAACARSLSLLTVVWYSIVQIHRSVNSSSFDGHLSCFQFLALWKAATNILVHIFW